MKKLAVDRWPLAVDSGSANGQQPTANQPRWPLLYTIVLAELAVTIAIFYAFTRAFS